MDLSEVAEGVGGEGYLKVTHFAADAELRQKQSLTFEAFLSG